VKSEIVSVQFHGDELQAVRKGEKVFVVVKRVCEALDISHDAQARRLSDPERCPWAVTTTTVATGADGKAYAMLCVDLDSMPMWLATIDVSRARPDARPKLIEYQKECARVLRDHFFKPAYISPLLAADFRPWGKTWRDDMMTELCKLKGEIFSGKHPRWAAHYNAVIYECVLGKEIYAELKRENPHPSKGKNHHQRIRPELMERFDKQLEFIGNIAHISSSLADFTAKLRTIYQSKPFQLPLNGVAPRALSPEARQ
jgi:hypothetical protein